MRRWIIPIIILLSLGATLYGVLRPRGEQGIPVNVVRAESGEFVREVRATGTVEARLYNLTFPRPGRVAKIFVKEGQSVQLGKVLAELDTADDQERLSSARENLSAIQTRLTNNVTETAANRTRLQLQQSEAERNLALSRRLLAIGGVSRNEVQVLERQVADVQAQLRALDSGARSARGDLEAQATARRTEIASLERTLRQAQIKAPITGTISTITYLEGVDTGASFVRMTEAGTLRVQARLSEGDIAGVKPGQPVRVELDSAPGKFLQAKVDRLGVQAEVAGAGGSAVLPVFVRFLDPGADELAKPGLTTTVRIITLRKPQAVKIPLETLVEENKQNFVWVIEESKKTLSKQAVTIEARNLTHAAVSGVTEKTLLVSLPPEKLEEGKKVSYVLPEKENK